MPPFLKFLIRRLLIIPLTLLIVTALLYAAAMVTPPEQRATLYLGNLPPRLTEAQVQRLVDGVIKRYGLDQPYPVQYANWLGTLASGNFGWSPGLHVNVLDYLTAHTPVTAELMLYSLLLFIPLGIISGVRAAEKRARTFDNSFRFVAFTATSIPPFILGLMMISLFYVGLGWFAPNRLSDPISVIVNSPQFHSYTGLITIDGALNGRWDITLDALKHLAMPVISVCALHWATLSRVTRAAMIDELDKDYVLAARSRGLPMRAIVWRHALRNALVPALTSSVLSAASLLGGVYVVELVFNFRGLSNMIVAATAQGIPDIAAALGFAIYNVIAVLLLMFVLDVLQAVIDPRLRERL